MPLGDCALPTCVRDNRILLGSVRQIAPVLLPPRSLGCVSAAAYALQVLVTVRHAAQDARLALTTDTQGS